LIDDVGEASLAGKLAHGANDEALSEEGMGQIGDFDRVCLWVLEAGIKRWLLSFTQATTPTADQMAIVTLRG
jgi:hypothetical protein